jgi:signal transduction histidine kinase
MSARRRSRLVHGERTIPCDPLDRHALGVKWRQSGNVVAGSEPERRHGPGTLKTEWSGGIALVSSPPPLRPPGGPLFAIAAVLVLVGISAILTAAWLARPLRVLSAAARDLGTGNLASRVRLRRKDELGDVALAFDEMAERIERLVRGQRELLANVSHELRTPLARIRVALDLASEGSSQDAAAQLSGIAGDLAELERLTNDILTSARLEVSSALPPLRVERTAAREMVEEAAGRFRALHPGGTLRLENGCGDAQVNVDRMMLRRALDNLLSNAEKHGGKDQIGLVAGVAGGRVTIEVHDRGAGIPPEDMKRIFTPFFRGDRSRARQTGGLGLGLLLARRILEAHRGTLEIESRVGEGTVARIRLHLEAGRREVFRPAGRSRAGRHLRERTGAEAVLQARSSAAARISTRGRRGLQRCPPFHLE